MQTRILSHGDLGLSYAMSWDLVIRQARVVSGTGVREADVAVQDGLVAEVGSVGSKGARQEVDAGGLYLLPGVIDSHVHFREPGLEHKEDLESGTRAAVAGGVTTTFEMPNTNPSTTTPEALADKLARAAGRTWCDHAFYLGATAQNAEHLGDWESLPGCCGIKMFIGSSTGTLLVDQEVDMLRVMQSGRKLVAVHAEDEARLVERRKMVEGGADPSMHPVWRDVESAVIATQRMLRLSSKTGRRLHVLHVTTSDEVALLAQAKKDGVPVTCEATPHNLLLDASMYSDLGTRLQVNPPVRDASHRDAIRKGLREGVFDVVGSDHAPHTLEEKAKPYPSSPAGLPGVQTLLPALLSLVHKGELSLSHVVRLTAEHQAKVYGIQRKGHIEPGFDADFVLLNPDEVFVVDKRWLQSRCGWSPFEGQTLFGPPKKVWLRGKLVLDGGFPIEGCTFGKPVTFHTK